MWAVVGIGNHPYEAYDKKYRAEEESEEYDSQVSRKITKVRKVKVEEI